MFHVLVTGGTGYIGSHTSIALAQAGYFPILLDNLSNSEEHVVDKIEKIIGFRPIFIQGNLNDERLLKNIFGQHKIRAVMHFAAYKSVEESVSNPLRYYQNNVNDSICLIRCMREAGVKMLVFSSSATVYGNNTTIPYQEGQSCTPFNPYGRCKKIMEELLYDVFSSEPNWRVACLRYFNPVGAHTSGLLGENPKGKPSNLMPLLSNVAYGLMDQLLIYGNDYPTKDGTCIRDYVHVCDLADGHVTALNYLLKNDQFLTVNLGSGQGYSVLELVHAFEQVCQQKIPYQFSPRRKGDLPAYWADIQLAKNMLGWEPRNNLLKMCEDTWRWQKTKITEKV